MNCPSICSLGVALLFTGWVDAAETGDVDGDGQVTLGDVVALADGRVPEPGSLDGLQAFPCTGWNDGNNLPGAIYLEALRRSVDGSLPHWWTFEWIATAPRTELNEAGEIHARLDDAVAPGGGNDRVLIPIQLDTFAALKSFFLIIDAGGLLRPTFQALGRGQEWDVETWTFLRTNASLGHEQGQDGFDITVNPAHHLITGGKLVVAGVISSVFGSDFIPAGQHQLLVEVRLPRGTRAGRYPVQILDGSQVLYEDGVVLRPAVGGPASITVENDVTAGWDEGVPALDIDRVARRVLGKVEFRLANGAGAPVAPGEPVAAARPGDSITLRVQMRTEVPLNEIFYRLEWPPSAFLCASGWFDSAASIYANPEDGRTYVARDCSKGATSAVCGNGAFGLPPWHQAQFQLAGAAICGIETEYLERPLEHFKPLGQWVDLTEVRLVIDKSVAGGERLPLRFVRPDPRDFSGFGYQSPGVHYAPYSRAFICPQEFQTGEDNWKYDVRWEDGYVLALGDGTGEPPALPDAGIRVIVGDASGGPGDLIDVPVFASASLQAFTFRIALELDPEAVAVDAVDFEVLSLGKGEHVRQIVERGKSGHLIECVDENGDGLPDQQCTFGHPVVNWFQDTDERFVLLDMAAGNEQPGVPSYPGPALREIARLQVKVREDFAGRETRIDPAVVTWMPGAFEVEAESGGEYTVIPGELFVFVSAEETRGGVITIAQRPFRRGDANADQKVDLSDAVAALGYLFLGAESVACLEAADADDSGSVLITDAIYLLGALFLGQNALPPPFPDCGVDIGGRGLGCQKGCP